MALKPVLLLGAGASIDAGLPNTFDLTQTIYEYLIDQESPEGRLFGYIISKLLVRNAREAGSPFNKIDVETAYDAVTQYISRDHNILSEFVRGWDDLQEVGPIPKKFDVRGFVRGFDDLLRTTSSRSLSNPNSSTIRINSEAARRIAHVVQQSLPAQGVTIYKPEVFIEALAKFLTPELRSYAYLEELLEHASVRFDCIATLNYDLLLENAADSRGISYDYGLKSWNLRRYIKFYEAELNIIKLHGSLNWYIKDFDDIEVRKERQVGLRRGLIFGGQAQKLFSDGPFLSLRQEYFNRLRQSNVLMVAGYSFSDLHINAMIRAWMRTRKKAKLIVVDPRPSKSAFEIFMHGRRPDSDGKMKNYVEICLIEQGLKQGLAQAMQESLMSPVPEKNEISARFSKRIRGAA